MTKIKGQNLRILLGSTVPKCIAMATSCQVHLAAQVQDVSTKDSDSGWQENEVTGLNWDAQVDALVSDSIIYDKTLSPADGTETTIDNSLIISPTSQEDCYAFSNMSAFKVRPGEIIAVMQSDLLPIGLLSYSGGRYAQLAYSANRGIVSYTNEGDEDVEVMYVQFDDEDRSTNISVEVSILDNNARSTKELEDLMLTKQPVVVRFATTTRAKNRETQLQFLEGEAIISDISITAANRETGTCTCQLTGVGELEIKQHNIVTSVTPALPSNNVTSITTSTDEIENVAQGSVCGYVSYSDNTSGELTCSSVGSTINLTTDDSGVTLSGLNTQGNSMTVTHTNGKTITGIVVYSAV